MIRWLIDRQLNAWEAKLGAPVDHLRQIANVSQRVLFKLGLLLPAASHRRAAPRDLLHAARIAATQAEDCGPCLQMAVNVALLEGVPANQVQSVLYGDLAAVPYDTALAVRFARAVVEHDAEADPLREQLQARFGEAAVIELALAIALARVFPTLKRGLGYATSCPTPRVASAGGMGAPSACP